jgi:endogenous inhibitor of DNA gyrase (YacG/DUF329 family)
VETPRRRRAVDTRKTGGYDGAVSVAGSVNVRSVHCPRCGAAVAWNGNANRPFCSLSCRLIDLGVWLDERYRVPGPQLADDSATDDRAPGGG